jgi:hypothetical protein
MWRIKMHTGFRFERLEDRDRFEGLSVEGRIILKCMFSYRIEGVELVHMAQKTFYLRAFVKSVLNNPVS